MGSGTFLSHIYKVGGCSLECARLFGSSQGCPEGWQTGSSRQAQAPLSPGRLGPAAEAGSQSKPARALHMHTLRAFCPPIAPHLRPATRSLSRTHCCPFPLCASVQVTGETKTGPCAATAASFVTASHRVSKVDKAYAREVKRIEDMKEELSALDAVR